MTVKNRKGLSVAAAGILVACIGAALAGAAGAQAPVAGEDDFTPPRTPWGAPNLQGIWSSGYIETPVERPDEIGDQEFLTDEDIAAERERLAAQQDHSTGGAAPATPRPGDTGTYNTVFSGRGRDVIRTRRTSLIIDPPEAKIPWKPGVREQMDAEVTLAAGVRGRFRQEGTGGPEDRPNDRCRGMILPHRFGTWESGGGHHRIVQSPDAVTIYYEYGPHGGAYRTIPLDGRPMRRNTSGSGSGTRAAVGRATRSSSRRRISPTRRATRARARTASTRRPATKGTTR